jgi:hypothetical protein
VTENDELRRRIVALERKMREQQKINEQLFKIIGKDSFMSFKFNDESKSESLGGDDFIQGSACVSRKLGSSRGFSRFKSF